MLGAVYRAIAESRGSKKERAWRKTRDTTPMSS